MTRFLMLLVAVVLTAACGVGQSPTVEHVLDDKALIVVSNYPLYYFGTRIIEGVEDQPELVFPDIDGDPSLWIPDAEQVQQLQSADLVVINGAGAEEWLNFITIDRSRVHDTTASLAGQLLMLQDTNAHQHGPEGDHSHGGTAFTTWLDPQIATQQAASLMNALLELIPAEAEQLQENLSILERELAQLDAELAAAFSALAGQPVLFSHPVYQYLERRYAISGRSVHWEPSVAPSIADRIALQQMLVVHAAGIMFWEDEPLSETAARLGEVGLQSIVFRLAANRPVSGDYISVMRENVDRLRAIATAPPR